MRGGLILTAGASLRMGREKALLPWGANTLLGAQLSALRPWTDTMVVVVGANAATLAPVIQTAGADLVVNPAPERGQFSSMQTGLAALRSRGCTSALITPVDCPPLSGGSMERLCAVEAEWAMVPEHAGRHGHPLLAGPALFAALLSAPVSSTARAVMAGGEIHYLALSDQGIGRECNTPGEYAQASKSP